MPTPTRVGVLTAVASAALFAVPAAAHAAPGDNGTVKIHDARTGEELRRNEPHVCTFYLDAFGFDGVQRVDWHTEAWAPTASVKGETVKSGALTLDTGGHGRTDDLSLPDGHYKLFWNFEGEKGAAKHKVFWTDCAGSEGGAGAPSGSASPSASAPGSSTASPGSSSAASPSSSSGSVPGAPASGSPPRRCPRRRPPRAAVTWRRRATVLRWGCCRPVPRCWSARAASWWPGAGGRCAAEAGVDGRVPPRSCDRGGTRVCGGAVSRCCAGPPPRR